MLTLSKPLSAGQVRSYHEREFASERQNYWSRDQQGHSEWQGRLAKEWGLSGVVGDEHFARLTEGEPPFTQQQMVKDQVSRTYEGKNGKEVTSVEHSAGWDATFSAPKSVSLTALVGGDDRVREARHESVRVALNELEHYTQARIGNVHAPETTGKFVAATFEHDTARPVEGYAAPQLPTHAVIFNVTERDNGQTVCYPRLRQVAFGMHMPRFNADVQKQMQRRKHHEHRPQQQKAPHQAGNHRRQCKALD